MAADYKSHCKADQPDIYHHQAVGKWLTYVKSSQYKNCKFRKAVAYQEAHIGTTLLKLRQICDCIERSYIDSVLEYIMEGRSRCCVR